ncbi:MAG: phosphate-selective porin OprO and OprP [Gemmatimonadales bacterium]|nr:phosphate-selective porin OprO and OprP [Gemmatimonadales bacterium]
MQSPALAGLLLSALIRAPLGGQYPSTTPPQVPAPSPVKLSGYIQAREVYQNNVGLTSSINRARLSASGGIAQGVIWRIQGEFRTGSVGTGRASVSLQDAYIRYNPGAWAVQAGQFKTPFTREFITSLADIETADRATAVDSFAPKRDIGLMAEYTYRRVGLWGGVFNGEGQNVTANTDSTMLGVARLAMRVLPHLAVGVNGARYFGDSTRYGVDAAYEDDRLALKGEYLGQARDESSGQDDWGWYGLAAVFVIPTIQAVGKFEEFARPGVTSAVRNQAWTAGLNVYPSGRSFRLTFDYLSRKIGEPGVRKGRLLAQIQAKF